MRYRKIPFFQMGAYGAEYPNSSFLSGVAPMTTVVMRADTTKPAGIPGFMSWLADVHPKAYNYAFAIMPSNLRLTAFNRLKTGGAQLTGSNAQTAYSAVLNRSTDKWQSMSPGSSLRGLGDDTLSPLMDMSFDAGSVPTPQMVSIADTGESTGTPQLSSAGTAQLLSTLTQVGKSIVTGVDQQRIFNVQLQRAQQGLPPLNTAAYFTSTGAALTSYAPWLLGGGVLALVLLSRGSKGK